MMEDRFSFSLKQIPTLFYITRVAPIPFKYKM